MARFVILPFSVGCASHSSVAVHENQPKRAQAEAFPATSSGDATGQQTGKPKNSFGNLSFPRPNLSLWFQKLIKSFKNLSNYFAFDEKEEDDDEVEVEMEIGLPTEVQHVTHIGLDGLGGGTGSEKSLDRAPELLSFPSFPLKQFEQALAAQTRAPPPPVDGSWLH